MRYVTFVTFFHLAEACYLPGLAGVFIVVVVVFLLRTFFASV